MYPTNLALYFNAILSYSFNKIGHSLSPNNAICIFLNFLSGTQPKHTVPMNKQLDLSY